MSMIDEQLVRRLQKLSAYQRLPAEGIAMANAMVESNPSRTVGKGALMNVCGDFASQKLGKMIQFESRLGEFVFVALAELDPGVEFILDQPCQLRVDAHDSKGRRAARYITPDFVVFRDDRFYFVEVKFLSAIQKAADLYPRDWVIDEHGRWTYRPGEAGARTIGFGYEVSVADSYSPAAKANLMYRVQVAQAQVEPLSDAMLTMVKRRLSDGPLTVERLCSQYNNLTGSQLLLAIQDGRLLGLLDRQVFDRTFLVFGTQADQQKQLEFIERFIPRNDPPGPMLARLFGASRSELDRAHLRMQQYDDARRMGQPLRATDYRILTKLRDAALENAPPLAAYVPDFQSRGGKGRPLDSAIIDSIKKGNGDYIKQERGVPTPSKAMAHWLRNCPEMRDRCSWESFRKIFAAMYAPERLALLTGGKRAFHQSRPPIDGRKVGLTPQICGLYAHIDGVYADAFTAADEIGEFLRPIYFPMVDQSTQYVIGRGIKLGKPSGIAYAMALRDCVARHGFIPAVITTDRGTEFINSLGRDAAAHLRCTMQRRPPGAASFGGQAESFNAQLAAFLQTLAGGTYFDKAGRAADGNKKGRRTADHDLATLICKIDHWIFNVWNVSRSGANTQTREELFKQSLQMFPDAVNRPVINNAFHYFASYPLRARSLTYAKGCRFGGKTYSSDELVTALRMREKPCDARLDSMDPSIIWLRKGNDFIGCYSNDHNAVAGMDLAQRLKGFEYRLHFHRQAKLNQRDRLERELQDPLSSGAPPTALPLPSSDDVVVANLLPDAANDTTAQMAKDGWQDVQRVAVKRLGERR